MFRDCVSKEVKLGQLWYMWSFAHTNLALKADRGGVVIAGDIIVAKYGVMTPWIPHDFKAQPFRTDDTMGRYQTSTDITQP